MINEVLEVEEYLAGKNISKKCLYRICYMLAKWYKQKGMSHIEIRQAIFDWGKKHGVYITYNLNSIIYQALADKHRLRGKTEVWISESDIEEITKRFDSKNCRKLALAILCIAKVSADNENSFSAPVTALSNWVQIDAGSCSKRYLPEMIDFGYISKLDSEKVYSWKGKAKSTSSQFTILVPIDGCKGHLLKENNISGLYDEIFVDDVCGY